MGGVEGLILGKKDDQGKLPWHLIPFEVVEKVVEILQFGAEKYGANNWKELPDFNDRYFSACLRHLVAWKKGEKIDPESGNHHLAHALCNLVFLLWGELTIRREKKHG